MSSVSQCITHLHLANLNASGLPGLSPPLVAWWGHYCPSFFGGPYLGDSTGWFRVGVLRPLPSLLAWGPGPDGLLLSAVQCAGQSFFIALFVCIFPSITCYIKFE
jgi:hypothetical protein